MLGNGLGREQAQMTFVRELLKRLDKPLVIDADALHATILKDINPNQCILTPHHKELQTLAKNNTATIDALQHQLKARWVILQKGSTDHIITAKETYRNKTGTPAMAVAGTGDVLAGLTAGFLAQQTTPIQAAINASYLNGKAGEQAQKDFGNFTAEELLNYLVLR